MYDYYMSYPYWEYNDISQRPPFGPPQGAPPFGPPEEEFRRRGCQFEFQRGFQLGYRQGFRQGFRQGQRECFLPSPR
jgi:hypothetical protein